MTIEAAADGSSLGNPGPAGWGWYVDADHWAAGGWPRGTNNMGELMALLDLLRQTAEIDEPLRVYCDSRYVIDAVTKWTPGWKRKGWRKADGQPVLNVELIKEIDELMLARKAARRPIDLVWVKGHAGHGLNEQADRLANGAAAAYQRGSTPDTGPGMSRYAAQASSEPPLTSAGEPRRPEPDLFSLADHSGDSDDSPDSAPSEGQPTDEQTVIELERSLLTGAVRTSRRSLDALLHPQWSEIGSSGRVLERMATLGSLGAIDVELDVIECSRLADDVILLVWRARSAERSSLRSSVWVRDGGRWRQRFHQGTVEQKGES
ncbi:MAG TPA: DUF4440 domain-containing protein [Dermatophilaceae bacterium]|nr:DUF4440 domain-containing protein [Dermatophilaceae bacterium]